MGPLLVGSFRKATGHRTGRGTGGLAKGCGLQPQGTWAQLAAQQGQDRLLEIKQCQVQNGSNYPVLG